MADGESPDKAALWLARYRVEGTLGEGAFGMVVRAFDTRLKRFVAIKTLRHSLADTERDLLQLLMDRFVREAEAGSRMGVHPNLVAVYDLAEDAERNQHLILEYVPGGTLASRLERGPLPLADALHVLADISLGLQAAHDEGIVHRDVKPANIFLTVSGRAKVGDFGIAQIDQLSARTHAATAHPGTLLYMSPEQSTTGGYLHPSSDQYSVGLVFFEAATGAPYKRLLERDAEQRLAAFPAEVRALFRRMVAPQPDHRYPGMAAVAQAAEEMARQLPGASISRPAAPPPGIAIPSGAEAGGDDPAAPQPFYWPQPFEPSFRGYTLTGAPRALVGHTSWVVGLAFSPDGETLASASVDRTVRLWHVGDAVAHTVLVGHTDWVSGVQFTDDGATLQTASHDDTIRVWQARDGAPLGVLVTGKQRRLGARTIAGRRVVRLRFPGSHRPVVARERRDRPRGALRAYRDGPHDGILAGRHAARVRLARSHHPHLARERRHPTANSRRSPEGGDRRRHVTGWESPHIGIGRSDSAHLARQRWRGDRVVTGPTRDIQCVAVSPDGRVIAAGSDDRLIHLWRASDGYPLAALAGHMKGVHSVAFSPDGQTIASGSADGTIRLWAIGHLLPDATAGS